MASVFRQQGSPYWYAAFFDGTGKRRHRSTKKTNRNDAVRVAQELERLARKAEQPGLDERSRDIMRILEEAGTLALRGTLSESKGREFLNSILRTASGGEADLPSVEQWLRDWVEEKRGSRTEGTYVRYESVIRSFLDSLPRKRKSAPVTAVTVNDIRSFRNALSAEGRSPATVNLAVKILRTAFNLARKTGYLTHNPVDGLDMLRQTSAEKDVFTPEQVAKLVETAKGDWKGLILAGFYTGARIGDLSNLSWDAVDLKKRAVYISQKKTGKTIAIPIHTELRRWLKATPKQKRQDSAMVFPSLAGKSAAGKSGLSSQFKRLMEEAGIHGKLIKSHGDKGRNRSTLSFHSLRHSFNSAMANAGIPQEMRQRLTGHASKAVNDIYTHTELETLRTAVEAVPGIS